MSEYNSKPEIFINLTSSNYAELTYHITPVLEITNGKITMGDNKHIPVILIGERHNFKQEDIQLYDNTYSLLDIIEKYVLYNLNKDLNARIVMHYEASYIKNINIEGYFIDNHTLNIVHNHIIKCIEKWNNLNNIKDEQSQILWQNIYESMVNIHNDVKLLKNKNIKNCEGIITEYHHIQGTVNKLDSISKSANQYLQEYSKLDMGVIHKTLDNLYQIKQFLMKYINKANTIITNYAAQLSTLKYKTDPNNLSFMSKLNLIYAGGWLKPAFNASRFMYLPYDEKDSFKCHLKLVETVSSITDRVEIYNIDYRTIIIDNLKSDNSDFKFENTYEHYSKIYDKIIERKDLYYTHNDNKITIENPIMKLYKDLQKVDDNFRKSNKETNDNFKKIFIESIVEHKLYPQDNDLAKTYYWILDLYSLLQFIYMSKQDKPPSIFITVLGDAHRRFQNLFLQKWYVNNRGTYNIYNFQHDIDDPIGPGEQPDTTNEYIYADLLSCDVSSKNINNIHCLKNTLNYKSNKYIEYNTYKNSLNSYDFFTEYIGNPNKSDIDLENNFKLDIVNNFGNICGATSLKTYNQQQKEKLFKYFESTSYLFKNDNTIVSLEQKSGGAGNRNQGDLLYQIQADFAQYYMRVCGYDDPVNLMNAIKIYLLVQDMVRKQINANPKIQQKKHQYIANKPLYIEANNHLFMRDIGTNKQVDFMAAGGGSFVHAFRVLLISALIVVLILLLCRVMGPKSNYPYMLENGQYPADLQTSMPICTYPYST